MRPATRLLFAFLVAAAGIPAAATSADQAVVRVSEREGVYRIAAEFCVPQSSPVVLSVLSDYEAIPRFMPDVKSSRIIQRSEGRIVVEQEASARLMLFSKRIQMVLEVDEAPGIIRFRDRSGKSFRQYEGAWRVTDRESGAAINYEVTARPAFDVPEFILTRLMKRDATRMIENLREEFAVRAAGRR
jgi:ribosome-associated toxin RatA of RatAB toxin-antitoxin module